MKNILYIWDKPYPWDVRAEKVCNSLVESGHSVHFLSRWKKGYEKQTVINGVNVYRVGYNKHHFLSIPLLNNPTWTKAINEVVEQIKPDLIIVREIILGVQSGKVAKKHSIPIIMDMAENYPAAMRDWKEYNSNPILKYLVHTCKLPDRIEQKSLSYIDGVITVCEEQIDRLNSVYNYNSSQCVVVHNTPLKVWHSPSNIPNTDKIIFLHHGHLTSEKDISKFLKGFLLACDYNDSISFVLAGGGHCLPDLKEIAERSVHSNKVTFLGRYQHEELADIISKSTIGVIPYQISDFNQYTIHNKIFDYFASQRPVIVSENRPSKRIIEETGAGWAVDCENVNSIKENILQITKPELEEKSKLAVEASQKYIWENDFKKLLEFLNRF